MLRKYNGLLTGQYEKIKRVNLSDPCGMVIERQIGRRTLIEKCRQEKKLNSI